MCVHEALISGTLRAGMRFYAAAKEWLFLGVIQQWQQFNTQRNMFNTHSLTHTGICFFSVSEVMFCVTRHLPHTSFWKTLNSASSTSAWSLIGKNWDKSMVDDQGRREQFKDNKEQLQYTPVSALLPRRTSETNFSRVCNGLCRNYWTWL